MELSNKSVEVFRLHGFFVSSRAQMSVQGKVYMFLGMCLIFFCLSGTQAVGIICVSGRNQRTKNHSCTGKTFFFPSNLHFFSSSSNLQLKKKKALNCNTNLYKL